MALNCEQAFSQEMAAFKDLSDKLTDISKVLKSDSDSSEFRTISAKLDETNRLLSLLCLKLLGSSEG